ncbi:hypothetical protein [Cesiribacter sp. SM1]|uniref:hypothetical protein n=1 Tax=Cesiribacter sp. SM1 TaxID=2861196 RepID=UPI001CD4F254|nr:hypothetical protein [Cesiribacter sp. SM1]
MEDKSNISIFQGSTVEADTVHDFLAQNQIASLVRNHMQESLDAGWVAAAPDYAAEVFVAVEDKARAIDLLKNLYHEEAQENAAQTAGTTTTPPLTARGPVPARERENVPLDRNTTTPPPPQKPPVA